MKRTNLSVAEFEQALEGLGQGSTLIQHRPGTASSNLSTLEVNDTVLLSYDHTQSCLANNEHPANILSITSASSPFDAVTANGHPLDGGGVWVRPPPLGTDYFVPAQCSAETLTLPEQRFYELAESVSPRTTWLNRAHVVHGNAKRLTSLRRQTRMLLQAPYSDPTHEFFDNLVAEWVAWLGQPEAVIKGRQSRGRERQTRIARQARTYFVDNYAQPIRMEDACREVGVGLRTLERCFAAYFQVSPCRYLKILRHNRARRALLEHDPSTNSVSRIAMDNGFYHFGRFAVGYRELFGELPRDTLVAKSVAMVACATAA